VDPLSRAATPAPSAPADEARPDERISAVIFDLGGVLIDWDPRHLYRKLFDDPADMERFLGEVATAAWNHEQDAGRPLAQGTAELVAAYPDQRRLIEAYYDRWPEMLGDAIGGTVAVLRDVRATGLPVYALSNWSAETFPVTRGRYPFLGWFDGVLISGDVGVAKPDPRIYEVLIERFGVVPGRSVFIDDIATNIRAAEAKGFRTIRFEDADHLRRSLMAMDVLPGA
jgi:2-haloacid dehalogenase